VEWLPPKGMTATMSEFDLRPGGRYRMTLRYDDASIAGKSGASEDKVDGRFMRFETDREVVQAVDFVSNDPRFAGTMTLTWRLTPRGDDTLVEIIAEDVPPGISAKDHADGLASSLENLADWTARN
jgi:uncharacterized protein YndB with AHSA1/START domain